LPIEIPKLIGKEKEHYDSLEDLYAYSCGEQRVEGQLCNRIEETIDDWDKMMGGRSKLGNSVEPHLEALLKSNLTKSRNLYFFLSPSFFYIHILFEMKRRAWRNAMTWCGIFCERIVRNLLQEIDRRDSSNIWGELLKDPKFDNRNGRLRKELELRRIDEADTLCSLLKSIYFTRSHTGPHDVPPPEPIQADLCVRLCLPAYVRYLETLIELGNDLKEDFYSFVSFFYNLAQTKVFLIFGEKEVRKTPGEIIKEVFRQGFFKDGKTFGETKERLKELGYDFGDPRLANELQKISKGKNAILTRRGKRKSYTYHERYPPEEFFKTAI